GDAEMMVASIFQAVGQVAIGTEGLRDRFATAEYLDKEMVVRGRSEISQFLVGKIPFVDDAEIELFDIPALGGFEIRRTHRDMVSAHVGNGRSVVGGGQDEILLCSILSLEQRPLSAGEKDLALSYFDD